MDGDHGGGEGVRPEAMCMKPVRYEGFGALRLREKLAVSTGY